MVRRHRWWFIALSLVLLAACVGVWNWSERPPFAFLEDSQLWFAETDGAPSATLMYVSKRPWDELIASARHELPDTWEHRGMGSARGMGYLDSANIWFVRAGENCRGIFYPTGSYPPIPASASGIVMVIRPAKSLDRIRSWLYGIRWKGSQP